ncbi:class I SAM-dependent methyltransferase [Roseofilum casamattae]|uniref:Class I SAM-dependent methyltransferase n=1 Tax=Roseofilum casamattae BLCC-M143 TaxID=3022442 RepID=A0ABT7BSM8_9CYAN|nr:class I SAM-dependent methyltransferase [Roseofilum casamattae]MDJ1181777.1 class I SAM-dependent methyltransferase [Roseofilum casamattae BLCC-M143]
MSNLLVDIFYGDSPARQTSTKIHPQDEMLLFLLAADRYRGEEEQARLAYFKSAQEIVDRVEQAIAWKFQQWSNIGSFLEFACGYGRLTRFWVNQLPPEKIWASDIYSDAVDFVSQEWGVHGIYSTTDPQTYQCAQKFNCIVVYSLFSHLPEHRFHQWLQVLYDLLLPDGMLLFSVHDRAVQPPNYTMPDSGILFVEQSESQSLDTSEYGSTWVAEEFVQKAIATVAGDRASYTRVPRAFSLQDLYILIKQPDCDFSDLRIDFTPKGVLESYSTDDRGRITLQGWAAIMQPDSRVREIQIWASNPSSEPQLLQRTIPTFPSETAARLLNIDRQWTQKSGWSCTFNLPPEFYRETSILSIKAISDRQQERIIYLNRIQQTFPDINPSIQSIPESQPSLSGKLNYWKAKLAQTFGQPHIHLNLDRATLNTDPQTEQTYLELEGWAISLDSNPAIANIEIWRDRDLVQCCIPNCDRPDVAQYWGSTRYWYSGWMATCYYPNPEKGDRWEVKAIDSAGEFDAIAKISIE